MSSLLYSLGRWSFRRRKLVVAFWIALLAVATTLAWPSGRAPTTRSSSPAPNHKAPSMNWAVCSLS